MNSNTRKPAASKQVADDRFSSERVRLIGELIVCEAERLADVCKRTKSIEPLQRMGWTLDAAMEQIGNQIGFLKYCLHISDKDTPTDQNGGQGDE
jgi:hypothetical protein